MRQMMESVVEKGGGRYAQIAGYRVAEKGYQPKLTAMTQMPALPALWRWPHRGPPVLCLVCLDEPHSWTAAGGSLSAPVCAEVLEQTLVYRACPGPPSRRAEPAQTVLEVPEDGDSFDGL